MSELERVLDILIKTNEGTEEIIQMLEGLEGRL